MRLCDLPTAGLEVVRDGEFRSLGLLFHQTPELLVCLYDAKARRECEGNAAISCVIAGRELAPLVPERLGLAVSDAPREAFCDVHRHLGSETGFYGEDFPAEVSPDAAVDSGAHLPARRVRIAAGCRIEPGAVVLEGSTLAEDVVVRAGAVVGAEGFQPVPYAGGQQNLPHYGSVELRRGVEVGANAVVCRSAFNEPTEIGEESVLGPQVYVAHGARIGARCRLAASARVAGSARLGDDVFVGPNAVVSSRVAVGSGARVSLGAVVVRDVPPGETVTGNFAVEHERFLAAWRALRRQAGGPEEAGRDRA